MPKKKGSGDDRFEVWGLVGGEWQHAKNFPDLASADAYVKKTIKGMDGVTTARISDTTGEIAPRDYNCVVAS